MRGPAVAFERRRPATDGRYALRSTIGVGKAWRSNRHQRAAGCLRGRCQIRRGLGRRDTAVHEGGRPGGLRSGVGNGINPHAAVAVLTLVVGLLPVLC
jgi:hypothetical protein